MQAEILFFRPTESAQETRVELVVLYDTDRALGAGEDLRTAQLEALRSTVAQAYAFTPEEYVIGLHQVRVKVRAAEVGIVRVLLGLPAAPWGGPHAA